MPTIPIVPAIIEEPSPVAPPMLAMPMVQQVRDNSFDDAQDRGLGLNLVCVYTSRFGRRVHLFPDGTCLAGANRHADGSRDLNTLQVCLTCQARFRRENVIPAAAEATDASAEPGMVAEL